MLRSGSAPSQRNQATAIQIEILAEHMTHWYLIHTKPACEELAHANLMRQGYYVYCPRILQPARIRGRWVDRIAPLFPRYLFLRLTLGQQAMGPVRSTVGVASIVRFGCDYALVPDEVMDQLRLRADPDTGLYRLASPTQFAPGSTVRIVAGAFDGLEGVFQRKSGDERVVVLLKLLGRETSVRIPAEFLLPLARSQPSSNTLRRVHHAHG